MKPTEFSIPGVAPVAKPAGGNPHVVNVTEATFATEVVERSKQVPVVVDLWAEWCAPCRQLGPVLERLAAEGNGSWVLAKVDVDANPRIAQALRVQGIPAVKAIVNADLVDEFTGALPEAQVREWLARLGVGADTADVAGDDRLVAALAAERRGDLDDALGTYRAVLADAPADPAAKAGVARIELVRRARAHDGAALQVRVAEAPDDVDVVAALADLDLVDGRPREAFGRLVDLVRRTSGPEREAARQRLIALFDVLPPDDAAVVNARRDLANALF
jgi:putative thioredoxin